MTVNNSDDLSLKKLIEKCKQDNQPSCIIEWLIDAFRVKGQNRIPSRLGFNTSRFN